MKPTSIKMVLNNPQCKNYYFIHGIYVNLQFVMNSPLYRTHFYKILYQSTNYSLQCYLVTSDYNILHTLFFFFSKRLY